MYRIQEYQLLKAPGPTPEEPKDQNGQWAGGCPWFIWTCPLATGSASWRLQSPLDYVTEERRAGAGFWGLSYMPYCLLTQQAATSTHGADPARALMML